MMIKLIANMVVEVVVDVIIEMLCLGLCVLAYALVGKGMVAMIAVITGIKLGVLEPILPLVLFFTLYLLFVLSMKGPIRRI